MLQLFVATGASIFSDPKHFSLDDWLQPQLPDGKRRRRQADSGDQAGRKVIAVLYQNDDFGKDYLTECLKETVSARTIPA